VTAVKAGSGLEVEALTVHFGGLVAVDGLTLSAPRGRLTGLIGPNGAGKTTTFNVCSGLQEASSGAIRLFGWEATSSGPAVRARRGLGRTFQRIELFDSLTVADNIALGREGGMAGQTPWRHVFSSRGQRRAVQQAVDEAVALFGLGDVIGRRTGSLSTGQRRLVELARAFAGAPDLVLLDEPSSGLDPNETRELGEVARNWVRQAGVGVLLVEHDMSLVMSICDYIYVLDFGKLIFAGIPDDVRSSPEVQAAYLGSESTAGSD
jgi:ABC-type branched-subunit amino acid transport system ATPase component